METMTVKRCSRCKQEKPVTEFNKNRRMKDELHYYCRECTRAYHREYAKKNAALRNSDETVIPSEKRCSRCKRELPVTEFGKNRGKKDGLHHRCRECHRAYNREQRKKNAARRPDEIPVPSEKRCPKCGVTRPSSDWSRNSTRYDGLADHCKPCMREYLDSEEHYERVRRWQKANPEKVRECVRRWQKANPEKVRAIYHRRRARKAGAFTVPHTEEDLLNFWRFIGIDPDKCWYCALDGRDAPKEHTDHLIPLSRGGSETVWNKRPACSTCNTSKGARVFPAGGGDEEARRIAQEQANLTRLWMAAHNLID